MIKTCASISDTYITNKIIANKRMINSNVGSAATLDLYKLYGINQVSGSNATELSRLLIKFDLTDLRTLYAQNKLNLTDDSFNATLKLFDVYGGQPTPSQFTIDVFPLSRSFDEGLGRDIIKYSDLDSSNFLSSTYNNLWSISGAYQSGSVPASCDYFNLLGSTNLKSSQYFSKGTEDLNVDVTTIISATLAQQIPDSGFLISFSNEIESDNKTYFVKRFASRSAYNDTFHPQLIVKYDDSLQDDSQNLEFDYDNTINLYNYHFNSLTNLYSGSINNELTGTNCLQLKLTTPISGGTYTTYFGASQATNSGMYLSGTYVSNVFLQASTGSLKQCLDVTGSITFDATWLSNDHTLEYAKEKYTFYKPLRSSTKIDYSQFVVTAMGVRESHKTNEKVTVHVNIFDYKSPMIKLVKSPIQLPGMVIKNSYYQIRDYLTSKTIIPFDTVYNSTKLSNDDNGMYFDLDMSNLKDQHSYIVDILLVDQNKEYVYREASSVFRVDNLK